MFSQHAITRMQQRGISGEAVELLLDYGRSSYHKGSEVVYLDRRSRSALLQSGALSTLNVTASVITIWCWGMGW